MIISHSYKFIFIKTRKTSGTSMEIALSKFCGPNDIITPITPEDEEKRKSLGFTTAQNFSYPISQLPRLSFKEIGKSIYGRQIPKKFYNHIPASIIRQLVPQSIFDNYYKFTIIRNPIDRALSHYFWTLHSKNTDIGFSTFLRRHSPLIYDSWEIISENNNLLLDDYIFFEDITNDIERIGNNIGLPQNLYEVYSNITAKSGLRPIRGTDSEYVGSEELSFISYLCKPEIETFGYL